MSGVAAIKGRLGRYVIHDEIASGGTAAVFFGTRSGAAGFARTVAIKRLLPPLSADPELAKMLLDEARLMARIHHPNVVAIHDVVAEDGELWLVMDYIHGDALSQLLRVVRADGERAPPAVVGAVLSGVLQGLHAAHHATNERDEKLELVHRDVSPQNVLVGVDGLARLVDFGIAKATGRLQQTREGQIKGKLRYMSPEQLRGAALDARTDLYSAGVVLWEALTGHRLFEAPTEDATVAKIFEGRVDAPSRIQPSLPSAVDGVVLRAMAKAPGDRFASAREMAAALEAAITPASPSEVGSWVERVAREPLAVREAVRMRLEASAGREAQAGALDAWPGRLPALAPIDGAPPEPPRRRLSLPAPAVAAVALLVLVAAGWVRTRTRQPPVLTAAPAYAKVAQRLAAAASTAAGVAETSSTAPDDARGADDASPVQPATGANTPARANARPPAPSRSASGRAPRGPRCQPPYTVDASGIHQMKPECL